MKKVKVLGILIGILLLATTSWGASFVITWGANTETDLGGYNVYDKVNGGTNNKVGSIGVMTAPTYTMSSVAEGIHIITVTAFDTSGNESLPSDATSATVDLTPPGKPSKPVITINK